MSNKFKPQVTIIARCPNGHETHMFPETCVSILYKQDRGHGGEYYADGVKVSWDCPVCPAGEHHHEVHLDEAP